MAPSCEDTARKQLYQQVEIRDFGAAALGVQKAAK